MDFSDSDRERITRMIDGCFSRISIEIAKIRKYQERLCIINDKAHNR